MILPERVKSGLPVVFWSFEIVLLLEPLGHRILGLAAQAQRGGGLGLAAVQQGDADFFDEQVGVNLLPVLLTMRLMARIAGGFGTCRARRRPAARPSWYWRPGCNPGC
jgi:hypothetical protein